MASDAAKPIREIGPHLRAQLREATLQVRAALSSPVSLTEGCGVCMVNGRRCGEKELCMICDTRKREREVSP